MTKTGPTEPAMSFLPVRDKLGESVFWCPREQALYWLDVPMPSQIHRWSQIDGHRSWLMPEMVASMAKRTDGRLLVASIGGLNIFNPVDGSFIRIAAPEAHLPQNRSNDGNVDARGRFWFGSMRNNIDADGTYRDGALGEGTLYKVEADLVVVPMEFGIGIPNATAFSPDYSTFYLADTLRQTIFAYDFDLELGGIFNKRVFSTQGPGYPDGACVDAEGFLWNARWEGGCVVRFSPDGNIDSMFQVPAQRVTSCCFGGPELDTLFITTSRMHLTDVELADQPDAGNLFVINPGVIGLARPEFGS